MQALVPKFLWIKALVPSYDGERITQHASRQFLCALIGHNHRVTQHLELDLQCRCQILAESPAEGGLGSAWIIVQDQTEAEVQCSVEERPIVEMSRVRENASNHAKWVVNLSSRTLSSAEKNVLSKGLNFAPAPRKIPTAHMVATVENDLRCLLEEVAEPASISLVLSAGRDPLLWTCSHKNTAPSRASRELTTFWCYRLTRDGPR